MAPGASLVRTNRLSVRSARGQPGVGGVRRGGADPWDRADLKPRTVRRGGRRDAAGCDRVQTWSGPARAAHPACAIIFTTTIIIVVVVILTWDGKCSVRNTARFCLVSVNFGVELCVSQVSCIYQSVYKLSCVHAVCCCLPEKVMLEPCLTVKLECLFWSLVGHFTALLRAHFTDFQSGCFNCQQPVRGGFMCRIKNGEYHEKKVAKRVKLRRYMIWSHHHQQG